MTKIAKTKTSSRKVEVEDAAVTLQKKMRQLAIDAYVANQAQNHAKKAYDKARGEVLGMMKSLNLKSKIFEDCQMPDGRTITLEAEVARPEQDKADVMALYNLVEKDLFLQMVSASKKNVEALAGTAVFNQVKVTSEGEENVTIKPMK